MKPTKDKSKNLPYEMQIKKKFEELRKKYPYSLNGLDKLFEEKDRFVCIGGGDLNLEDVRFYTFTTRDYSALSQVLNRVEIKEQRLREKGINLDGIKSFNRNVWLDFSKESNAIEGIIDDFGEDMRDFRLKLRGKIASEPREKVFDKLEYYHFMIKQCDKAIQDNDCRLIRGRNVEHQLSLELVKHFLALKYAYKCAKLDKCNACENAEQEIRRRERYKILGLSKREIEEEEKKFTRRQLAIEKNEFENLILEVHSFLFDSHPLKIRNVPNYVNTANWAPPSEQCVSEYLDNLAKWIVGDSRNGGLHPLERAAIFHVDFVHTHPFVDGNGRTARIMSNYLLMQYEMPTISINHGHRQEYFDAIDKAVETNDIDDLIGMFYDSCMQSARNIEECLDKIALKNSPFKDRTK